LKVIEMITNPPTLPKSSKTPHVRQIHNLIPAVCGFLLLCLSLSTVKGQEPEPVEVVRVDSNLVSVPVIVSDRQNRYVPGLKVGDFKLYDNSMEQQIAFFDAAEEPLNVALLLDTSRSTQGVLDDIKKAAKNFLKELRPQDRAMIVSFDFAIQRLSPLTNDRKVLEKAIKYAKVGENVGTTLNDAVMEVMDKDFKPIIGRKAIILLTDGQDYGSQVTAPDLHAFASESDTMVYSIFYASSLGRGFGNGRFPFPGRGGVFGRRDPLPDRFPQRPPDSTGRRGRWRDRSEEAIEFLTKLSEETSGRFYRSDVTDLKQSFDFIAEELRYQYRLGFYPHTADGNLHALKVSVERTDLAVRARRQYRTAQPK
jgi:VWFA-related protein